MIAAEPKTTGQYQPYPEYKDSGVEWLGEVPTNWSVATLRHALAGIKNGSTATQLDEGIDTVQISRIETISTGEINHDKVGFVEFVDALHHYRLNVGDILFSHINSLPMVGNIAQYCSKIPLYHGMNLLRLQPSAKVESRYLYWWLKSTFSRQSVESLAKPAINQASIAIDQIKSIPCLYPMWDEQCIIAAFLDYETARIDRLIAQQQRLIELLKEKRQAVISHAVTKGLNPNAPMKDSGVEWLGQVPEHWVVSPLKYKCEFSGGGTPSKDNLEYWNGSIPWVSPKDMKSFWITDAEDKITEQAIKESSTKLVQPGAVLMVVRSGILQRTIPVGINTIPVTMNQDMKAIRFSSAVYAEWLSFFIKGYEDSLLLDWRKQGATVESIEHEYLANSLMLFPPEEEARSIIAALGRRLDKFDQLEQRASDAITLLQECRTALISAAVTGKIDLRSWTPPAEEAAA
ncbi:MAG: restriction endonuclease subunit S [Aeromonas sp.]